MNASKRKVNPYEKGLMLGLDIVWIRESTENGKDYQISTLRKTVTSGSLTRKLEKRKSELNFNVP